MTLDTAINLPTVITLIMAIIGVVIWLIRMEGKANTAEKKADDAATQAGAIEALVMLHKEQFHEYQLQAAKEFMTQSAFGEIKREIVGEINRMEQRLEAQIERVGSRPPTRRTTGQS
jgi:predicted lipid-binding transport protein (Tim44 family)